MITVKEAAKALAVKPVTIRRMIKKGELVAYRIRGTRAIRILKSELERAKIRVGPSPKETA